MLAVKMALLGMKKYVWRQNKAKNTPETMINLSAKSLGWNQTYGFLNIFTPSQKKLLLFILCAPRLFQ